MQAHAVKGSRRPTRQNEKKLSIARIVLTRRLLRLLQKPKRGVYPHTKFNDAPTVRNRVLSLKLVFGYNPLIW